MASDLDSVAADVREALSVIETAGEQYHLTARVEILRTELLRLTKENADASAETITGWRNRALDAEAELATLKRRIDSAPVLRVRLQRDSGNGDTGKLSCDDLPPEYIGKRVRLLLDATEANHVAR